MHLKLLEDFITLAGAKNFSVAARQRNVTHPAFGRRIKALENWIGASLVQRASEVQAFGLTPAGDEFLTTAKRIIDDLQGAKQTALRTGADQVRICTGRTLARTMVADWLTQIIEQSDAASPLSFNIRTASLHEAALSLEAGQCHFMIAYHHRTLELHLDQRRFSYKPFGSDKLVAVRAKKLIEKRSTAMNIIQFSRGLALRKIFDDGMNATSSNIDRQRLQIVAECDSPDAVHALALKGIGVAWLPWSLVANDCKQKRLTLLEGQQWPEFDFNVRIYRKRNRLSTRAEEIWVQIDL
jgi:LysR family transcriptional regulator, hypochlorite-specific transcription factor HypT